MNEAVLVSVTALGQAEDGKIYITKTEDKIFEVTSDATIIVKDGVNAKIVDKSKNSNISLYGEKDSVISYYILDSVSTKRCFDIKGELNILEVSISSTNETLNVSLTSENATCDVKNLSILNKVSSNYLQQIDHTKSQTFSNIKNVGVAMEGANLTFDTTGKIFKGMNKSKCAQLSRGIVMDNDSIITAKPILLIDEYDCFANHGATIGKMSDEDLFYLMSRGLTKKQAFLLILEGIVRPFIDAIPLEDLRKSLDLEIKNRIGE